MAEATFGMKEAIGKAIARQHLTQSEAAQAVELIMSGEATPAQIAAFLVALRMKGETVEEIAGAASVMRAKATRVPHRQPMVADTCGTGGGRTKTFNISTAAVFVVAGAGLPVAKHGNRSFTSQSGSADVLEALGVAITLTPEQVGQGLDEVGIGFLFAPALHGAMKHAVGPRREIGTHTLFNFLGPLTNPAGAQAQVIGVFLPEMVDKMAAALALLGTHGALVVHGDGGIDELSISGPTQVAEVRGSSVRHYAVHPEDVGLPRTGLAAVAGGTPQENALVVESVLRGQRGPARDIVVLNAAAALYAADRVASLAEGVRVAQQSIDSGAALEKLDALRSFTQAAAAQAEAGASGGPQ